MLYHPNQPDRDIPFTSNRAFYRYDGSKRIWLTYSSKHSALFCSICLAFGTLCDKNTFTVGVNDWRHIYQRIEEHEKSKTHGNSVDAYFLKNSSSSVDQLLIYDHCNLRKKQVDEKRQVLTRIIDIIKMIGKRGLSYRRTSSNEAAYTLNDHTIDHGTFLETVILLSKYYPILKLHVDSSIEKSKLCHNSGSKQGGGTLTFLSKTTVGYILDTCSSMIKSNISKEVIEAGMYSIQLDTTQDTSISDQCSIIIRYVSKFSVKERLLAMIKCNVNLRLEKHLLNYC
ncbi:zinc finger MYM-type protein 1-like [Aphis gossypii]|uniref:zinc finger MYM-type protein 1-like n=1 Tax=Aphis gossypii TaxID=80765 RepID=UPI0021592203|nr:zinc finger MYM-type protein 1-like [Aphis gossypii]